MSDDAVGGLSFIEVNTAVCKTPGRPWLIGRSPATRRAVLFQPRCGMWSCPVCGQINRALWVKRAFYGLDVRKLEPNPNQFLTLTSHARLDAPASLAVLADGWDKLLKRIRRAAAGFDYVRVVERHEDGRVHLHLLETAGLGTRWFKDNSAECGLGYMAEEEELRSAAGGAYYVGKYLVKSLKETTWPKNFKRITTSRSWPKLPPPDDALGWAFELVPTRAALAVVIAEARLAGYEVVMLDHLAAWRYVEEGAPA